jgi:hypothetical protein
MNTQLQKMPVHYVIKHTWTICAALLLVVLCGRANAQGTQTCLSGNNDVQGDFSTNLSTPTSYHYELYRDGSGTSCITTAIPAYDNVIMDGAFKGNWSNVKDYLARVGFHYDDTQTPDKYGTFYLGYDCTFSPNASDGLGYLGIYGWFDNKNDNNNLVEYYILENWVNYNPGTDANAKLKGTFHCDGSDYDVYTVAKNGPTIKSSGNLPFTQYWSIRKNKRTSGSISVTNHFLYWKSLGLTIASLHEVSMLVEGYADDGKANGSFTFNSMGMSVDPVQQATSVTYEQSSYSMKVGDVYPINFTWAPSGSTIGNYYFESSNKNVVDIGVYKGYYSFLAKGTGTATISMYWNGSITPAKVQVTVGAAASQAKIVTFSALGSTGTEQLELLVGGKPLQNFALTKSFQTYSLPVYGSGDVNVEFLNDDGLASGGRDVRLDYIAVDGVKRETEAVAVNPATYKNGTCGGSYSEWLNCNGAVNFGPVSTSHTIAIRARGTAGNEHMNLLINGKAVNGGWTLPTTFQTYTATVNGDGDINVQYDNDYGNNRDVVVDYIKVDNQSPRQSENMQYNTAFYANGRCGGGSYSEWMNCNGVIGYGKISDNFGARTGTQDLATTIPEKVAEDANIVVYPNPSTGDASIKLGNSISNATVKLYDVFGGVIYSRENINENIIHVSGLKTGIYIVSVHHQGGRHNSRLIVR